MKTLGLISAIIVAATAINQLLKITIVYIGSKHSE